MIDNRRRNESGALTAWQFATIGLSVLVLILGSFSIWAYVAYNEAKSDVQSKIDLAVSDAKNAQKEQDRKDFNEERKDPRNKFSGPTDYCSLTFKYPQTWSQYVATPITNGGDFKAYFKAGAVPPVSETEQFALRVVIEKKDYDKVIAQYQSLIDKGDLKKTEGSTNGKNATRLSGIFSKYIKGYAAVFDCLDNTITLRTDVNSKEAERDFEQVFQTVDYIN